jgi:hypothetical protein
LLSLRAIFDFKTSFFKKEHAIKKKSPCLGNDSKHIFEFQIAQVIPEKNGFKKRGIYHFTFILSCEMYTAT